MRRLRSVSVLSARVLATLVTQHYEYKNQKAETSNRKLLMTEQLLRFSAPVCVCGWGRHTISQGTSQCGRGL